MKTTDIAPCGMNCVICSGYLREKNKCPGCRSGSEDIHTYCKKCIIKNCSKLDKYCFSCLDYPCKRLKALDKRYRTRYDMSMIENLDMIKDKGIREFIRLQKKKYERKNGTICVHDKKCYPSM